MEFMYLAKSRASDARFEAPWRYAERRNVATPGHAPLSMLHAVPLTKEALIAHAQGLGPPPLVATTAVSAEPSTISVTESPERVLYDDADAERDEVKIAPRSHSRTGPLRTKKFRGETRALQKCTKWTPREGAAVLRAVSMQQASGRGVNGIEWEPISQALAELPVPVMRTGNQARNWYQRHVKGMQRHASGKSSQKCTFCGFPRAGHVCFGEFA